MEGWFVATGGREEKHNKQGKTDDHSGTRSEKRRKCYL
jgi:hypothetical protein